MKARKGRSLRFIRGRDEEETILRVFRGKRKSRLAFHFGRRWKIYHTIQQSRIFTFCTIGFDKRSSFIYRAQSYKRLVYLDLRVLLFRFFKGCNFPAFYKKKLRTKLSRASIFAYERSFLPIFLSLVQNVQAERLGVVLTGETWKERKKRRKKRSLISKARVWLAQREILNSFSEYRACSLTRLPGRFSNCSAV